jgi:8-oxo-dGTP diphosphatase
LYGQTSFCLPFFKIEGKRGWSYMKKKRGHVWLAAAGIVLNDAGDWLVVKKKYGGLQGQWSLPAGFVQRGETADEAVIREVEEETGIQAEVIGLIGLRTGVIDDEISDNMMIFLLKALSKKWSSNKMNYGQRRFYRKSLF